MIDKAKTYPFFALFTSNGFANGFKPALAYSSIINEIPIWELNSVQKPVVPLISYDLKNRLELLHSHNKPSYHINELDFIVPEEFSFITTQQVNEYLALIEEKDHSTVNLQPKVNKEKYLQQVNKLKHHIQQGDIYEVNYCVEFFAEDVQLDPLTLFKQYNQLSKSPMACYIKYNDLHLICGSPERFLKRTGNALVSQPIKGTRRRGATPEMDASLVKELENDQKERSENIMIVDLVRNDLSRIAERGTVHVDELCRVYTFETVHQSISTVSCQVKPAMDLETILKATFPMGSMTGAPKIRAMQLIDETETSRRQLYSGSTGYILPGGDFDLNVIIRTMVYDVKKQYLSFMVGSAITAASDPEKEYEECLVKASAMVKALNTTLV